MKTDKDTFEHAMTYIVDQEMKKDLRRVFEEHQNPKTHPSHEWVQECIRINLEGLRRILKERGEEYGVDVLFNRGQRGVVSMCEIKLDRVRGALEVDADTADSWIDLAGYAMLGLIVCAWSRGGKETNHG